MPEHTSSDSAGRPSQVLRVLLISPIREIDPNSGDVTYTEQLLADPPPGVQYTTYDRALSDGTLLECGTRDAVRDSAGRERTLQLAIAAWRKLEYTVRRSGVVYREPLRIWRVAPGAYDVVHVHVFHARFLGEHPPIVVSAAGPLRWVYGDAWGWSPLRRAPAELFDRIVGRLWNASMCGVRRGDTQAYVTFSQYFRSWLIQRGWRPDGIEVIPNYLALGPNDPIDRTEMHIPNRLGFVAKDFTAKGGEIVLAAFEQLRARHPELELTIVGSSPLLTTEEQEARHITWLPFVPRERLLRDVMPGLGILVYPSLIDGLPYGPMEAMSMGTPLVVSDYRALPELVGDSGGEVSRVGDVASVVTAVERLLDRQTWAEASTGSADRFRSYFSSTSQAPRLAALYESATQAERAPSVMSFTPPETASVVIATYNRPDHVKICLEHLANQTYRPLETVVVDGSPDRTTEDVVRSFPGVRYLRNNLGRGHTGTSRIIGVANTTGAVVAFIDDDAYAEPTWLAELLRRYDDPQIAAVGGRARNGQPGEESEGWDQIGKLLPDGRLTGNFAADPGHDVEVDHLLGANMSVRRDIVEQLGGLQDHYPGTCLREETDIALRMRKVGYRIVYTPAAIVRHVGGTYAKGHRFDTRYKYYGARNHMVLLAHTFGLRDPHTVGNVRAVAGWVTQDLEQAIRAPFDPERTTLMAKLRGIASPLTAVAAHSLGTLVGGAVALRLGALNAAAKRRSADETSTLRTA